MNGSASLRSVSRTQHGSGIPVTRSMVTSPKLAQKIPRGGATKQVTEIPVNTKAAVVSKEKAEGMTPRSGERNPLLFRKTGIPSPRSASEASERRNVTRSAFSSPQTRRKEAPRSKDTLDVNRKSLPLNVFRDLRRNGNSQDGNPRVGSNANVEPWEHSSSVKQAGEATAFPVKGRSTSRYSNENLLLRSPGRKEQKVMTQGTRASCGWGSFSDEEMGTPEDLPSKPVSPTPLCPPGGATVRLPTGTQLSRTIMATVAPFRLQVNPENDVSSLEDFSDCSSDSLELCCQDLDPESQRKRTVQNVLDLRQNLEDTMSSLRGAQLSHSCLENSVCYDSDEANPLSMSSMSNRSSPLSWRYGQSSPRLQAGDAPSSAGGYHGQGAQYAAHTMPMRSPSRLTHISRLDLIEGLDPDDADLKSGYMSDSDLLGKCMQEDEDDDLTNGEELLE